MSGWDSYLTGLIEMAKVDVARGYGGHLLLRKLITIVNLNANRSYYL